MKPSFLILFLLTTSFLLSSYLSKNSKNSKTVTKHKRLQANEEPPKEAVATCKSIGLFTGDESSTPKKVLPNKSGICQYLTSSCCTNEDLQSLKNWWEGALTDDSGKEMSREQRRVESDTDIVLFTSAIIKLHANLSKKAIEIETDTKEFPVGSYCNGVAAKFNTKYKLEEKDAKSDPLLGYFDLYEMCSSFIGKMQSTVLCATCDPLMQEAVNLFEGKVMFDNDTLKEFNKECGGLAVFNQKNLWGYLKEVEFLTRCDLKTGTEGHVDGAVVELNIGFDVKEGRLRVLEDQKKDKKDQESEKPNSNQSKRRRLEDEKKDDK